ncbi:MAG: CCA tRNA nucleotidyltransferase [Thaumarchaeota archaeon]|nr:CCA tRNA nucleotidyltransferase [Nitrososphaerota archaeon]
MTERIVRVLEQARKLVVPDAAAEAKTRSVAEKLLSRVSAAAKSHHEITGVFLGGSFAKGTWLPDDVDIDIFVEFDAGVDEKKFEEIGLKVGREAVRGHKYGKKYAQHPYTEALVDGFKANIVPCYDVGPGEWKSAADRSMHHVTFVNENLDGELKTEVRLLKKFMKVVGVYGAEIEREGFSGYAAEVLVYIHRTFESALRSFETIRPKSDDVFFTLFDPIDKERDLGKAISRETVARMVLASRALFEKPAIDFFRKFKRKERPHLLREVYLVAFEHKVLSEDTLWGELKRSARQVAKHVEREGFTLARFGAASDGLSSSAIILLPEVDTLPELEEREGPGVELFEGAKSFASKNRKQAELFWVGDDGRLRLLQKRRFKSLSQFLDTLLTSGVKEIGASREIADAIERNGRVLHGERLRKEIREKGWLREGTASIISDPIGV